MMKIEVREGDTRTSITSDTFSAFFWHTELLLNMGVVACLLNEETAREYAEFVTEAANVLARHRAVSEGKIPHIYEGFCIDGHDMNCPACVKELEVSGERLNDDHKKIWQGDITNEAD